MAAERTSRREFIRSLIPKTTRSEQKIDYSHILGVNITRRQLMSTGVGIGVYLAMPQSRRGDNGPASDDLVTSRCANYGSTSLNDSEQSDASGNNRDAKPSLGETTIHAALFTTARIVAAAILSSTDLPISLQSSKKDLREFMEKPMQQLLKGVILYPPLEEGLFRYLPSRYIAGNNGKRWDIGIPTSVIFALIHNVSQDDYDKTYFQKRIPLLQLLGGLFYWYLMRERGFSHATLGHSTNNAIGWSLAQTLYRVYP